MDLTKNKAKYIKSLQQLKHRRLSKQFVAEGTKLVEEMLHSSLKVRTLVGTQEWFDNRNIDESDIEKIVTSQQNITKISSLSSPQEILAIVDMPENASTAEKLIPLLNTKLSLMLDRIQDPGNLGTILRIADWFGIQYIIAVQGCVDVYSPKTVQATMGAICRVKVIYMDEKEALFLLKKLEIPVYGTFLEGESIYTKELTDKGVIVMGNEANGIGKEIENNVSDKLLIPNYPADSQSSESLNVAVATAIICSEFRRR